MFNYDFVQRLVFAVESCDKTLVDLSKQNLKPSFLKTIHVMFTDVYEELRNKYPVREYKLLGSELHNAITGIDIKLYEIPFLKEVNWNWFIMLQEKKKERKYGSDELKALEIISDVLENLEIEEMFLLFSNAINRAKILAKPEKL